METPISLRSRFARIASPASWRVRGVSAPSHSPRSNRAPRRSRLSSIPPRLSASPQRGKLPAVRVPRLPANAPILPARRSAPDRGQVPPCSWKSLHSRQYRQAAEFGLAHATDRTPHSPLYVLAKKKKAHGLQIGADSETREHKHPVLRL